MALKKMSILAYSDGKFTKSVGKFFSVLINPDTYNHNYAIGYNDATGQGSNGAISTFQRIGAETVSFKITFDGTGVVPGPPADGGSSDVVDRIERLKKVVFSYNGDIHSPNFIRLTWGTLLFKGRLKTLGLKYTLFTPDGKPVRAEVDLLFVGYTAPEELAKEANKHSPDLSRLVTVTAGDTLPLLCYRIYGTSVPYAEVARVNRLTGFRRLEPGMQLLFPPVRTAPA